MYKGLIFDLDGTLLNTSADIQNVLNNTLSHFSLPKISLEKTIEYVGNGAKKLVERALPDGDKDKLGQVYAHYVKHFAECDNELTCLYDGERDVLLKLKAAGVKMAIITNKPQAATDGVYAKHLCYFNFDVVAGQSEDCPLKPNPQSTLDAIALMGLDKSDCLFIGDGETDVATALNAGIDCLSVLWGYRPKELLKESGAVNFASNYEELYKFVMCK